MQLVKYKDLEDVAQTYLDAKDLQKLKEAFLFAQKAHKNQKRQSGEAYIYHPLAVTKELASLKTTINTLMAGLLHDVVEDCDVTNEDIAQKFGDDVAKLVGGVTKLSQFTSFKNKNNISKNNIAKILLHGATDIRIFLIKLCDRIHNISTIASLRPDKQYRIAKETLDYYSPIALKLSLYELKRKLELKAFPYVFPEESKLIKEKLKELKKQHQGTFKQVQKEIMEHLDKNKIKAQIYTRIKTGYSIYRKIYIKAKNWNRIYDIFALRIITSSTQDSYKTMGVIHSLYSIVPRRIKDFISLPKKNGYQSIHTSISHKGLVFEAQIRTRAMDIKAQFGAASHWSYKTKKHKKEVNDKKIKEYEKKNQWLDDIRNYTTGSKINYFEDLTRDVDSRLLYILTPDSKVINIAYGATVLDFAYKIHTDIGNRFAYAIVNGEKVYHDHQLSNGSTVKIVTKDEIQVEKLWVGYVRTNLGLTQIKKALKAVTSIRKKERIDIGKKILLKEYDLKTLEKLNLDPIAKFFNIKIKDLDDLYSAIGNEEIGEQDINLLNKITGFKNFHDSKELYLRSLIIKSEDVEYSQRIIVCPICLPIPGDTIYGNLINAHIIKAHRIECDNISKFKKINLYWDKRESRNKEFFKVFLTIKGSYGEGFINFVMKVFNKIKINVLGIRVLNKNNLNLQRLDMEIIVEDKVHLDILKSNLLSTRLIHSVKRKMK